jgi:hypothetical protein
MCKHLLRDIVVIPRAEPAGVPGVSCPTQNFGENFGINSSVAIRFSCLEIKCGLKEKEISKNKTSNVPVH